MKNFMLTLCIVFFGLTINWAQNVDNTTQGTSYATIQAAIDAANPNNVSDISVGTYSENLSVNKNLTVKNSNRVNTENLNRITTVILKCGELEISENNLMAFCENKITQSSFSTSINFGEDSNATYQNNILTNTN